MADLSPITDLARTMWETCATPQEALAVFDEAYKDMDFAMLCPPLLYILRVLPEFYEAHMSVMRTYLLIWATQGKCQPSNDGVQAI